MARPRKNSGDDPPASSSRDGDSYHHGDLRRALIEAAVALLAERGLDGFSLREVSRRAGVSPAAPSHHFKDARGLLSAVAADGFRKLQSEMILRLRSTKGNASESLSAISRGYIAFTRAHPAQFALMFRCHTVDMTEPELASSSAAAFEVLRVTVEAARRREVKPGEFGVSELVFTWSLVHGFAHLLSERQLAWLAGDRPLEPFLAELFEQLLIRSREGAG